MPGAAGHPHRRHLHRHAGDVPAASARMGQGLRWSVFAVFGLLWLSGILWLGVHWFLRVAGEFGFTPHPAEPLLMRIHGILAVAATYLLGWLTARHVVEGLRRSVNRTLGITLSGLLGVLAVSGYALYYASDERVHVVASVIHEIIGVGIVFIALVHWWRPHRRAR